MSFVKTRLKGLWEVKVPNEGTQFRSRDYYPEATMAIVNGDLSRLGRELPIDKVAEIPKFTVASVDGYGNLKTTIRKSELSSAISHTKMVRITINNHHHYALNTACQGIKGKIGDLCMVSGSSGGRGRNFLEIIKLQRRASDEFAIEGPSDDLGKIDLEPVKL